MAYSSKGPEWLDYVKPEITCFASSGTSFSTPVITGLAACILEKKPELKGEELKQVIIQASSLSYPNNYIGYGVPDGGRALKLVDGIREEPASEELFTTKNSYKLILTEKVPYLTIYHKDGWKVLEKKTVKPKNNECKIKKLKGALSSTVIWKSGGFEIFWTD